MQNVKDRKVESRLIKCLVLGDFGTGKSVFASSFPQPGYIFDFDNGMEIYREGNWLYDTFPMTAKGWVEFEKAMTVVEKAVAAGEIKTVVLDSLTAMNDTAMERALQIDPKRSAEGGPIWNVHYQIQKNLMAPRLRRIISYPCNVVITGHWKVSIDSDTGGITSIDPLVVGDLSQKVPGFFDEVYVAQTVGLGENVKYVLRTAPHGLYKARSRLSGIRKLLPSIVPNNYTQLIEHVNKALEKVKQ